VARLTNIGVFDSAGSGRANYYARLDGGYFDFPSRHVGVPMFGNGPARSDSPARLLQWFQRMGCVNWETPGAVHELCLNAKLKPVHKISIEEGLCEQWHAEVLRAAKPLSAWRQTMNTAAALVAKK
jgi:hypothetical protein